MRKHEFDEPIVRVDLSRLRFPNICPVCGRGATTTNQLNIVPQRSQHVSLYGRSPSNWRRLGVSMPDIKTFRIHVCEDHDVSDNAIPRFRAASSFYFMISLALTVFAVIFIGGGLWLGRGLPSWTGFLFLFVAATFVLMLAAFRPEALEAAVKIVGFDANVSHVWFQFRSIAYRDLFLKENAASAELVKWVRKV